MQALTGLFSLRQADIAFAVSICGRFVPDNSRLEKNAIVYGISEDVSAGNSEYPTCCHVKL